MSNPLGKLNRLRRAQDIAKRRGFGSVLTPEEEDTVARCYSQVLKVMDCKVDPAHAGNVLKAATMVLDSMCGKIQERIDARVEHEGLSGVVFNSYSVALPTKPVEILPDEPRQLEAASANVGDGGPVEGTPRGDGP